MFTINQEAKNMKRINSKKYFKLLEEAEEKFYEDVQFITSMMQQETKQDDIEFFEVDGHIIGIGNVSRTMKLIHRS